MAAPRIQFRPGEELSRELVERSRLYQGVTDAQRDSILAETLREQLSDYYLLMKLSLPRFSLGEAMLMVDAMNGCILDPHTASLLWANISDAIEMDRLDEKWQVDGNALVIRLRELGRTNPFACWSIADAIERAWNDTSYYIANMEERVKQVGLVGDDRQSFVSRNDENTRQRVDYIERNVERESDG